MVQCSACKESIPADAVFCGVCGFRQQAISERAHRTLSETYRALGKNGDGAADADTGVRAEVKDAIVPVKRKKKKGTAGRSKGAVSAKETANARAAASADAQASASEAQASASEPEQDESGRRDARRFPIKVEVSYSSEHNFYTGFMQNLSSGGLFVATHEPVSIGDRIALAFSVPGLEGACTATCEVRWVRIYDAGIPDMVPGMGLRFVDLAPEVGAAIELFIKHREPIFFDDED